MLRAVRLASAACAVSAVGFTLAACAVFAAAPAVFAQSPGGAPVAGQPPAGQPGVQPPGVQPPAADPKLDGHLRGWEQKMAGLTNFHAAVGLTRTEAVFKKNREYTGSVLCMKPNYAILRLESPVKPPPGKPVDYEAFVCTGDAVYEYNGLEQTVTRYKIANAGQPADNLMLDFLSGMKADDAKRRFQITLFNEDQHYVYLDIKPLLQKDRTEFEHVRFALYGPNTKVAYLPAQVWLQKPSGDTELWKFTNPQTNVAGINKDVFKYTPVVENGKQWPLKEFQPPPPAGGARPPAGGLPAGGGAIRP